MRKIIAALLILTAGAVFAAAYLDTVTVQRERIQTAATRIGRAVTWPDDPRIADPAVAYAAMLAAAGDAQVNLFRTSIGFTATDVPQTRTFALLTGPTRLYSSFTLAGGHWLTAPESQSGGEFLSTSATGDPRQAGTLRVFGGGYIASVEPMRAAFDTLPVAGQYVVESRGPGGADAFLRALARHLPGPVPADEFGAGETGGALISGPASILTTLTYVLLAVITLLLVFFVLFAAKRVGVMRLHGLGSTRIWYRLAGRDLILVLSALTVLALVGSLFIPGTDGAFVTRIATDEARTAAIVLIASSITCAYILRVNLSNSLKNRNDTLGSFVVYTVL